VLWVGTDDGNVQRSANDGRDWTELSGRLPGLPRNAWINGIEPSRHADGRAYVVVNNYRNGDFGNYVYRTEDHGRRWTRIDGTLPARRVARTLREDPRNPDVLYLGTELGLYWSNDRGSTWIELRGGLPLMAYNDLFIHPREHDLVVGSHSRGIWILDNVRALQELTPQVMSSALHLFSMRDAEEIRYRGALGHVGDMFYRGQNPPAGALVDFWLRVATPVSISISADDGREVARLQVEGVNGVNRAVWNLSHAEPGQPADRAPLGPLVTPGRYVVKVSAGAAESTGILMVREDPRITVDAEVRRAWTETLLELATLRREARALATRARGTPAGREATELASRTARLYGEVSGEVGALTAQQRQQRAYYERMLRGLLR